MAKIPYTKLKIKTKEEVKEVEFNSIKIEVKQYLPIQEKLELIGKVLSYSHEETNNFSNPIKEEIWTKLEIIYAYTNLTFTDKQKLDTPKLYDELYCSGLIDLILQSIPETEINIIINGIKNTIEALYKYQNSALGILQGITNNYDEAQFDVEFLQKTLQELENSKLVKDIIPLINNKE